MPNKKIFLFLIIIIICLVLTKLFHFLTPPAPVPTPSPIIFLPTPTPAPIITPLPTPTFIINKIISQLPIVTPEYTIQYFPNTKEFIVLILQNPYDENRAKVESWFKEQGTNDLSTLNIFFGSSRGVAP